jgi:hypothetical protein
MILVNRGIDATQIYLLKILLSLSVGIVVATLPGFAELKYTLLGVSIRAAGGAAAFVFVYVTSPALPISTQQSKRPQLRLVDVRAIDAKDEIRDFIRTWLDPLPVADPLRQRYGGIAFGEFPIVDVKLTNYGSVVALAKRIDFRILDSTSGTTIHFVCSPLAPSWYYNVGFSRTETVSLDIS